jgi:hypothetical protein
MNSLSYNPRPIADRWAIEAERYVSIRAASPSDKGSGEAHRAALRRAAQGSTLACRHRLGKGHQVINFEPNANGLTELVVVVAGHQ